MSGTAELESLYSVMEETAGLLDITPSRERVWPVLTAYASFIPQAVIAFRVATRDTGTSTAVSRHSPRFRPLRPCRGALPDPADGPPRRLAAGRPRGAVPDPLPRCRLRARRRFQEDLDVLPGRRPAEAVGSLRGPLHAPQPGPQQRLLRPLRSGRQDQHGRDRLPQQDSQRLLPRRPRRLPRAGDRARDDARHRPARAQRDDAAPRRTGRRHLHNPELGLPRHPADHLRRTAA